MTARHALLFTTRQGRKKEQGLDQWCLSSPQSACTTIAGCGRQLQRQQQSQALPWQVNVCMPWVRKQAQQWSKHITVRQQAHATVAPAQALQWCCRSSPGTDSEQADKTILETHASRKQGTAGTALGGWSSFTATKAAPILQQPSLFEFKRLNVASSNGRGRLADLQEGTANRWRRTHQRGTGSNQRCSLKGRR